MQSPKSYSFGIANLLSAQQPKGAGDVLNIVSSKALVSRTTRQKIDNDA